MTDQHELSGLFALDALDDADRIAYEAHMVGCAPCRQEVAEFRATMAIVASFVSHGEIALDDIAFDADAFDVLTGDAPPPALRSRVLRDITTADITPADITSGDVAIAPVVPIGTASRRRAAAGTWGARRWMPAAAAAAIVIALVGGLLATRDSEETEAALLAELQSQGAPTFAMSDSGDSRLVLSADGERAVIVASGVPPLDGDHAYQAWTIDSNADVSPAPLFRPDASGNVLVALRSLPDDLDTVAVTIEPRSGSKLPTTPVLMQARVSA